MVFNSYTAEFCRDEVIHTNSPRSLSRSISNRIRIWWVTQRLKADIRQERKALASLPDNLLRDIGITRARLLLRAAIESKRAAEDIPMDRLRDLYECDRNHY